VSQQEKSSTPKQATWLTFAHLFAFGVLLALAMMLVKGTPGDTEDAGRVVFTEADVAQVRAIIMRTWKHPPTAVELRKGFEQYIRDEILYREAIALNLDRADPTVRLAMVRKITMMGTAQAEAAELKEEEIQAYFTLRTERYRMTECRPTPRSSSSFLSSVSPSLKNWLAWEMSPCSGVSIPTCRSRTSTAPLAADSARRSWL